MHLTRTVSLPAGFIVEAKGGKLVISKGGKTISRAYPKSKLDIIVKSDAIEVSVSNLKNRPLVGTFAAHVQNMIDGLTEPFVYELKICSVHFPMSAKLEGKKLLIQNFFGCKSPRKIYLPDDVDVKVQGDTITVSSYDIELAGMTASRIELSTRLCNKDRRIFQDGIYMTKKPRKMI